MPDTFLAINKDYFGKGLNSCELLILSQIEEFIGNGCVCYVTDKQFMNIIGRKTSAVRAALDQLEEKLIIVRNKVSEDGSKRRRTISLRKGYQERIKSGVLCDDNKTQHAKPKNNDCNVENQHIKDKVIDNKKINLYLEETSSSKYRDSSTARYY